MPTAAVSRSRSQGPGWLHRRNRPPIASRRHVDPVGRVVLFDPAMVHHRDTVAEHEGLLLVVRDEHGRDAEFAEETVHLGPHLDTKRGVEVRERFVEQDRRGRGARARARATRCCWPPDRVDGGGRANRRVRPARASRRRGCRAVRHVTARTRCSRRPSCVGTAPSPGRPCRCAAAPGDVDPGCARRSCRRSRPNRRRGARGRRSIAATSSCRTRSARAGPPSRVRRRRADQRSTSVSPNRLTASTTSMPPSCVTGVRLSARPRTARVAQ